MTTLCKCGCGVAISPVDKRGRPKSFVAGHGGRGKKHSEKWSRNQSVGMKRAWLDPDKLKPMRHQSPELVEKRVAPLRGIKHPPEFGLRISERLTGKKLSPDHANKAKKNLVRYAQLSPEQKAKRNESISKQRMGTHGFGRAERDRLDHNRAKRWIIRDPRGVPHECDNLQAWCRANESLFLPDMAPMSKLPLWRRAVGGFNDLQRTDRKGGHHWRGWTLVSVIEIEGQGDDLIARNYTKPTPATLSQ